ncbi:CLUMA_CG005279, isoform C [Clunio marinus]|uniref:CLUMA_CG005279, isoform C n=1 Tax=Clunio marinus TaxID=568069 RepID=A0A1J1HUE8_9DIPT|nr:CLUMA_CG005279, isoform C [Clunio marinus]
MPSPSTDAMDTSSQYSSCETLDSHRSSECDEKSEVNGNDGHRPSKKVSVEHTEYIQKERITRAAPPKPAYNPMQFVAIKPSNLFQTAQEQLKKAEEIRKAKEVNRKEEPEDWQNNLDNWKSSRRKRVEHIIDRVVEVKKLEEEEHDRNRRKSKTFNELREERGSRSKLSSLAIYPEEDSSIDMSGLKASSEANDDSSDISKINSDNHQDDVDKNQPNDTKANDDAINNNNNNSNGNFHSTALIKDVIHKTPTMMHREVQQNTEIEERMTVDLASKTYTMSVSTKTTTATTKPPSIRSSFESRERDYTYDDAIEDYKSRVSKTTKLDLPKVDIHKRRELFEKETKDDAVVGNGNISTSAAASKLGTEIVSIKDRISSLRNNLATTTISASPPKKVELPTTTKLKDRLSSLQLSSPVDEPKRNPVEAQFKNIQEVKNEFETKQQQQHPNHNTNNNNVNVKLVVNDDNESLGSTDREDSGIQTTDVSCAVSQADEQTEQHIDEFQHVIEEKITKLNDNELVVKETADQVKEKEVTKDEAEDVETIDDESSVIEEALDMAFKMIDNENEAEPEPNEQTSVELVGNSNLQHNLEGQIYQNVQGTNSVDTKENIIKTEPHYQVPRSREPYYEIPKKPLPIPVYENVELMFPASSDSSRFSMAESNESFGIDDGTEMVFPIDQSKYLIMEPPKEKPPPLPAQEQVELSHDDQLDNFKRINSTKRIKKEIRNKRSSFLGIEGQEFDDYAFEMSIAPPPDMQALLQEEKRLEKQLYEKVGLYQNSDNGESRDSGLSDNHSRQSSEPSSTSSEVEQTMGEMSSGILMSEQRGNFKSYTVNEDDNRMKTLEEQISKQEEVLRVEQLLLQIEQQELKRQRENLILRKNLARRELDEGVKMLMTNNPSSLSLQDLNNVSNAMLTNGNSHYENINNHHHHHMHPIQQHQTLSSTSYQINDYRKSMPNLQEFSNGWNSNGHQVYQQQLSTSPAVPSSYPYSDGLTTTSSKSEMQLNHNNLVPKPYQPPAPPPTSTTHHHSNNVYNNMTRHALMQISAVPKPKLTNDWVQYRKSEPVKPSINSHWLIQEAEQRRIEQMNNVRSNGVAANGNSKKPLPESVIQTLTQRVQNMGLGVNVNKRYTIFDSKQMPPIVQPPSQTPLLMVSHKQPQPTSNMIHNPLSPSQQPPLPPVPILPPQLDVLSVSSKKLCSYCNHELGSGAAMIIENLGLFYHIDCFKCSVCQTPISDGNIHGTDVRVRNSRLHCHNCFSNEEGVKFSCV